MISTKQAILPGLIEGELETVLCRGHAIEHLRDSLASQDRCIIALWPVCQSEWEVTIAPAAPLPPGTVGHCATYPSSK